MICFKVVRVMEDGKLTSAVVRHSLYTLTYEPNKPTTARVGGCLAFTSCRSAEDFATAETLVGTPHLEIWEAIGEHPVPLGLRTETVFHPCITPDDEERVIDCWNQTDNNSGHGWPNGTVAFKMITLIRIVRNPE